MIEIIRRFGNEGAYDQTVFVSNIIDLINEL